MQGDMEQQQQPYQMNIQRIIEDIEQLDWTDLDQSSLSQIPKNQFIQTNPTQKYLKYYKRFRGILNRQQISARSFLLTKLILRLKSTNYYALMLRSKYFFSQPNDSPTIEQQIFFTNCIINLNSKQYQIWTYKKKLFKFYKSVLINRLDIYHIEDQFLDYLLDQDTKNYHVWDYKLWITQFYGKEKEELQSTKEIIFKHNYNKELRSNLESMNFNVTEINWKNCYSLWSFRYNLRAIVAKKSSEQEAKQQEKEQIELIKKWIIKEQNSMNQSGWNYLTGFIIEAKTLSRQLIQQFLHIAIELFNKNNKNRFAGNAIIQFYDALEEKYEVQSKQNKRLILHKLLENDNVRELYYKHLLEI